MRAVAAAPRSWETASATLVSWFPAGSGTTAVASPSPGSKIRSNAAITLTFSKPVHQALGGAMPPVSPITPGAWHALNSHTIVFRPEGYGYGLGAHVAVRLPAGVKLVGGRAAWRVPRGSTLRLQQLLAQLGYLPLRFDGPSVAPTPRAQEAAAVRPPRGSLSWRYGNVPSSLHSMWAPGTPGEMTKGAVMAFENDQGMIADGVAGSLHPLINLTFQTDLRPVVDARRADEEADLFLLHVRESLAHRRDQFLADVVRDHVERRLLPQVGTARFEENVEAGAADEVRGHERLRKTFPSLAHDRLAGAAEELVEEGPAVLGLDRFELLDVDVNDADLALFDQHFFEPAEHHRNGRKSAGAIEEHALRRFGFLRAGSRLAMFAMKQHADPLDHFVTIERFDEVVVGAELKSGQPVLHISAAGDEHDRNVRGPLHRLQRLADFPAAALRHHDVEKDDGGESRLGNGKRLLAVFRDQKVAVQRPKVGLQQEDHVIAVVRNQ